MLGRDCLPTTPSDSRTHAQRAHTHREQQSTPFMRLRHASGSTRQHPGLSSEHANKAWMCSSHAHWLQSKPNPQTMHPRLLPRPLPLPDARLAVSAPGAQTRPWHAMRAGGRAQHCRPCSSTHLPGLRAPEARSRTISCPFGLQFAALAQICAKQGERAAVESRASSRAHLLACPAISTARPKDSGLYWVF